MVHRRDFCVYDHTHIIMGYPATLSKLHSTWVTEAHYKACMLSVTIHTLPNVLYQVYFTVVTNIHCYTALGSPFYELQFPCRYIDLIGNCILWGTYYKSKNQWSQCAWLWVWLAPFLLYRILWMVPIYSLDSVSNYLCTWTHMVWHKQTVSYH